MVNSLKIAGAVVALLVPTAVFIQQGIKSGIFSTYLKAVNKNQSGKAASSSGKYSVYKTELNFYKAQEMCAALGLRLATFDSQSEYHQLVTLMKKTFSSGEKVWVAASDLSEENKWTWMTTGKKLQYTAWCPGQPTHEKFEDGETPHCVTLCAQNDFKMHNIRCSRPYNVACEKVL